MEKITTTLRVIKSSLVVACFHALDKHFGTLHDFETAGEAIGESLSRNISEAVRVTCQYCPPEYMERLERAIRRGINRC